MTTDEILRQILAACERTAAACERLADCADGRPAEKRKRKPKGDVLTVTGKVASFGDAKSPTTGGKRYFVLKLDNGFYANVFSESDAAACNRAAKEGIPLMVDYVINGRYSNIESVRLGADDGRPAAAAEEEEPEGAPF